jgi:hypothetical protein
MEIGPDIAVEKGVPFMLIVNFLIIIQLMNGRYNGIMDTSSKLRYSAPVTPPSKMCSSTIPPDDTSHEAVSPGRFTPLST